MATCATGNYTMTLDKQKKTFSIFCEGIFTPELGAAYFNEFNEKSKSIDPQNYILIVDVIRLNTLGAGAATQLIDVLKLYLAYPFKKRYITNIKNAICQIQVKKLGAGISNFNEMIWVDRVDNLL